MSCGVCRMMSSLACVCHMICHLLHVCHDMSSLTGVHISGTESYSTEPQQQLANVGGGNAQSGIL